MRGIMNNVEKAKAMKESFRRYMKASKENKPCKQPCIKNGRSDRYCLECANEILQPIFKVIKDE